MKRRDGSSRRQVLNLGNASSSSWKNRYQSISEQRANGSSSTSSNPLSKLVGNYASESDDEEDNSKSKSLLDAEVQEFMKEVESTKGSDNPSQISCAWQECFDETTGYPYYWNMNSNQVTWEPPPELVAYQAAVAAKLAQEEAKAKIQVQHAQWAVEQAALGITPEYPTPHKSIPIPVPSQKKSPSCSQSLGAPAQKRQRKRRHGKRGSKSDESDDEKIEMITSWVDEESEDDEEANKSHKKTCVGKQSKDAPCKQSTTLMSCPNSMKPAKPPKQGPPTNIMFGPQLPSTLPGTLGKAKSRSRNGSIEEPCEVESKVVIQKLRRLKTESDVIVGTRERVPIRKTIDGNRGGSPCGRSNLNSNKSRHADVENDVSNEKDIASRLQKQVQLLTDLGGTVPNDIKDLLISSAKCSSSSVTSADNIIAMIEMEQPPDHKQDERLLSTLRAAEQRIQTLLQKIQAEKVANGNEKVENKKPSSFALIAGYGEDSDQEEAGDSDASSSNKDKLVKDKTLFPILSHDENSREEGSTKFVGNSIPVPDLSNALKASPDVASKALLVLEPGLGQKRRKRLDIGAIHPQPPSSTNNGSSEGTDEGAKLKNKIEVSSDTVSYTTMWSNSSSTYSSDPTANDRRGFGFQTTPSGEEETTPSSKPKKGQIQFIKAETINTLQDETKNVRERETESDPKRKEPFSTSCEDGELQRSLSPLAELVKAKLRFLSEGKEPVSPVQAMAIQIETLVSAWNAGALANSFLQRWLQSTGAELVQLERAAAPQGWAVQWDRYDIAVT